MAEPLTLQDEQKEPEINSKQDIELYYKAYSKYKSEIDESNAESRERSDLIYEEHQRLRKETIQKVEELQATRFHTPETQIRINSNVQELNLEMPMAQGPVVLHVIMGTGASLSMFTGSVSSAWTNLCPCLYSVTGCFRGERHSDLQMGQFHGIVTLDSGEAVRVIIPESVYIPPEVSHSYLLANTPFLMTEHQCVNDLYTPVLKFKGGAKSTLSVQEGHHILRLIPIDALTPFQHRTIYLHNDEPSDPPTFVNETLFQNLNRPCFHTHCL